MKLTKSIALATAIGLAGVGSASADEMQVSRDAIISQTEAGSGANVVLPMIILALLIALAAGGSSAPLPIDT